MTARLLGLPMLWVSSVKARLMGLFGLWVSSVKARLLGLRGLWGSPKLTALPRREGVPCRPVTLARAVAGGPKPDKLARVDASAATWGAGDAGVHGRQHVK